MKLNKKKHFIVGSYPGAIYFSWLAVVLFIAFIFLYESTNGINPFALVFGGIFLAWLIYTYLFSYVIKISENEYEVKLPFKKKFKLNSNQIKITQPNKFITTWFLELENHFTYKLYFSKGNK